MANGKPQAVALERSFPSKVPRVDSKPEPLVPQGKQSDQVEEGGATTSGPRTGSGGGAPRSGVRRCLALREEGLARQAVGG